MVRRLQFFLFHGFIISAKDAAPRCGGLPMLFLWVGDYHTYRPQKFLKFDYILVLEPLIIRTMEIEHYHSGMIKPEVAIEALKSTGLLYQKTKPRKLLKPCFFS